MTSFDWMDDDDAMMAELRTAITSSDAVPERLLSDAEAAFAWRTVDEELERLTLESDSLFDDAALVRGTGDDVSRILSFEGAGIGLEIEISERMIVGQVFPMRAALITIVGASGPSIESRTDDRGCFVINRMTRGPLRVRCDTQESSFITDWLAT